MHVEEEHRENKCIETLRFRFKKRITKVDIT
jgi:hypothetical protein